MTKSGAREVCGDQRDVHYWAAGVDDWRGVDAIGLDISPGSVGVARQRYRHLRFFAADMRDLPAADGSLAGIVAFYSVIHLPSEQVPVAPAKFRGVLAPGGVLLMSMHAGEGESSMWEQMGPGHTDLVGRDVLACRGVTCQGLCIRDAQGRDVRTGRSGGSG